MASPATANLPRMPFFQADHAIASSAEAPKSGSPAPQAIPFAVATPMRTPVNEPGPRPTSTASTSDIPQPALVSASRTDPTSSTLAWRRQRRSAEARTSRAAPLDSRDVHRATAQASMSVDVSNARTMRESEVSLSIQALLDRKYTVQYYTPPVDFRNSFA